MKKWKVLLCIAFTMVFLCSSASAVSLKKGSKTVDAVLLNDRLVHLGYSGIEDVTVYSDKTVEAVKDFQEKNGLKVTGSVNDDTWKIIFDEPYRLYYKPNLNGRMYSFRGSLAAPMTSVKVEDDSAIMEAEGFMCAVGIDTAESLDSLVKKLKNDVKTAYEDIFVKQYEGKGYQLSGDQKTKFNGRPGWVWSQTWNLVNGDKLKHYTFFGVAELDEVEGAQLFAVASIGYNVPPQAGSNISKSLGMNVIKETLTELRCRRDILKDYQEGAAKRKKASKLKLTLPEFQPVEENRQSMLDMLYEIRQYVNPSADGSGGEIDGDTCVSLYYGAKIMQYYTAMKEAGNTPDNILMEMSMSLLNGVFDNDLKGSLELHTMPRYKACLDAAKLALTEEAAPYLVLLGIDTPRWTAEELDAVYQKTIRTLTTIVENARK